MIRIKITNVLDSVVFFLHCLVWAQIGKALTAGNKIQEHTNKNIQIRTYKHVNCRNTPEKGVGGWERN